MGTSAKLAPSASPSGVVQVKSRIAPCNWKGLLTSANEVGSPFPVPKWDGGRVDHTLDPLVPLRARRIARDGNRSMELTTAEAMAQRAGEMARIGARVRELRKARGLTQQELSDVVGLHRVNLNKFENGRADLGVSRVRALAGALGVGPGQLFE